MSNATIRDVAREAAVSVASVSRVMNGHENVRPALKLRVENAATALGYVPHAGARNLSLARANAIGVVLPDLHGEFFSEFLRGMDREASARGFQLLLSNIHADPDHAVAALRTMRGRVDGMIVMAPHIAPDLLAAQLPPGLPVVMVNCAPHHDRRAGMQIDNAAGAGAMVDHLVASGRRRIVHLSGPGGNVEATDRAAGYRAAMAKHGLTSRIIAGDFNEESGAAAAAEILHDPAAVDALFAANDMMAIGAMVALRHGGLTIPDDIAVAGFDDIPLARLMSPALTTMSTNIDALGARAMMRLADIVAGTPDDAIHATIPRLVVRDTTAKAAGTGDPTTNQRREDRGTS